MRTIKTVGTLVVLVIALSGCAPSSKIDNSNAGGAADIRGYISSMQAAESGGDLLGTIMIEGVREADTAHDKASVNVTRQTAISEQREGRRMPATFDSLRIGARVQARFAGPVMESYPVQATASEVIILQPASDDKTGAGRPSPLPTAQPTSSAKSDDDAPTVFEGTVGVTEKRKPGIAPALLRDVRASRHEEFDRVVFEFEGTTVPGYHIEYVDRPVRQCGSGKVVQIAGDAWLRVRLEPANAHTEAGQSTIETPHLVRRLGLPVIKEMVSVCDFEAQVEWVLGVSRPNHYRILELGSPARLVVDVKH